MTTHTEKQGHYNHFETLSVEIPHLVDHLRLDGEKVAEPKGQVLFETPAELLADLIKAFDDYKAKSEPAWQTTDLSSQRKE
jgi:hypothetical protein